MSNSSLTIPLTIQCSNPTCLYPDNALGQQTCDRCHTLLTYSYLWAVGTADVAVGSVMNDRYLVKAPQIWLDTTPVLPPDAPSLLPDEALPYLHLYSQRLHLSEVRGFYQDTAESLPVLLLQFAPIDAAGKLFPTLESYWATVAPARQVYWLWQLLELWTPLHAQGVASSLLVSENIRVEGWRVRLCELYADGDAQPSLGDLATLWLRWMEAAESPMIQPLRAICQQMQTIASEAGLQTIAAPLNTLLLAQAAQLPLRLKVAVASSTGPQRAHNEDAYYPPSDLSSENSQLAIVCDGVGGHAGGEVASQLAVRSLQLQTRALLAELLEQTELLTPDIVTQQLEAIVRVVNNLIASQNDTQGRESRQRMGTTLVMALQLPQQVMTPTGSANAHELYLVNVGDSRAYWITPRYCHQLTVDDDVATREVRLGRSLHADALRRSDGGALTQALGTRDAEFLRPSIQRFILEEDGLLLLCSDGLSDHDLVERSWQELTRPLFKGKLSLMVAAQSWVELANQRNGHDNTSVVLLQCLVSPDSPQLFEPAEIPQIALEPESELSASSKALLYGEEVAEPIVIGRSPKPALSPWAIRLGLAVLLVVAGALGVGIWRQANPIGFDRTWEPIFRPNAPQGTPQSDPTASDSPPS